MLVKVEIDYKSNPQRNIILILLQLVLKLQLLAVYELVQMFCLLNSYMLDFKVLFFFFLFL